MRLDRDGGDLAFGPHPALENSRQAAPGEYDKKQIAIIGGGPAGLMAAETLSRLGHRVVIYDTMPTVARKFLLAGKSGLNITHSEDYGVFANRFGAASSRLRAALDDFQPDDIRAWAKGLGTETFIGSSGRVFPKVMKASPLLRAWLAGLQAGNVSIMTRHRWCGFEDDSLVFETPNGRELVRHDVVLLALGGASYARLGSDAAWVSWLRNKGIDIAAFQPANCGFDVTWSATFSERFAGEPLKAVTATSEAGTFPGEFVISKTESRAAWFTRMPLRCATGWQKWARLRSLSIWHRDAMRCAWRAI